jgi:asparagine N-glycosylation enzyme membrane subunit Stt3
MRWRRAFGMLGLVAALAAGVAFRLHTWSQARDGGRVRPLDSDSAYHMRRARFAAAHFPRTILFDPLMNFPQGAMAIWPPLFDLGLAAPARLAYGPAASADSVERGAAWVPVALAAGAIALAGAIARRLYGPLWGAAAAVFLAICPGHILWTQYAHTDQHAAESFCGLLALGLYLRSRERPDSPGNWRREAAAGLALSLAVLSWQGGIYWGAIFALSLAVEAGRTGRPVLRAALLGLGVPALLVGAATAAWLGPLRPPITYISFGFFQPLFLAAILAGTAAASLFARALRGRLGRGEAAAGAAVVLVVAAVLLPVAGQVAAGFWNGFGYVARRTHEVAGAGGYVSYPKDWLHGIFEARPLLADGPGLALRQLSPAFFLAPLAVLVWAARAWRGARPGVNIALAVWGTVTLFLALSQRLNVYYAAPLAAFAGIEAARAFATRAGRRRRLSRPRARAGLAFAAVVVLAAPMGPGLAAELSAVYVPGSDLLATLERMRTSLPHAVDAYDPGLLGPPPYPPALSRASSVLAPWSMGHLVLYEAEEPVVANNFGYGFLDTIRFFLSESEEEALSIARRRRARWILVTDLVPRMNDYASYLGRPPYLASGPNGPAPSRAYFTTMQSRLYDFDGRGARLPGLDVPPLSRVRLLFHSQSAIRRGGRWIPLWKVFEIAE